MIDNITSSFLIGVVVIIFLIWYFLKPKHLPPGPRGLPILGYIPFIISDPIKAFSNLGKKYGSICSIYLGSRLVVVLNDYEVVKNLFVSSSSYFNNRPKDAAFNIDRSDSVILDYKDWREHRRFALGTFRDFGMGKLSLEPKLTGEIEHFLRALEEYNGKAHDFSDIIGMSVANNICSLVFGQRFDYKDKTFLKIKRTVDEVEKQISTVTPRIFFPWLSYIPGLSTLLGQDQIMKVISILQAFTTEFIDEHRNNHYEQQKDDYVHAYISQQNERTDNLFSDTALQEISRGFFAAGTATLKTWLSWTMIYLATHQDMQKKIQKEIDQVIGRDRAPNYSDRTRTPYTSAFNAEIGRFVTVVPFSPPHSQNDEARIGEFRIPANTYVIVNIWNIHHDAKLWGDPEVFRPERFINSQTGEMHSPEYYIPFGQGKRACLGESLARMEVYLYVATMAQKFTFLPPDGEKISTEGKVGIAFTPKKLCIRAIRRS